MSGLVENGVSYRIGHLTFDNVSVEVKGGTASQPVDPPEYAGQYPDPNLWGDVPAYGLYLRHVDGVSVSNTSITVEGSDARPEVDSVDVTNLVGRARD